MQLELRSRLVREIEGLNKRADRLRDDVLRLKSLGRKDLARKLEDTELKEVERDITNKWLEYGQSLEDDYGEKVLSLGEIFEMELLENKWIVEKLVPDTGITAISGIPGAYKSWLSVYLAKCLCQQKMVFGEFAVEKRGVLIVDLENSLRTIRDRLELLGLKDEEGLYYWKGGFSTDDTDDLKSLKATMEDKKIGVVVFDSLVRIHDGDENDARAVAAMFKKLKELTATGVAVIFLHHSRKQSFGNRGGAGESMRGSSDILAAIDSHLLLEKTKDGVKVTQTKLRQDEAVRPFSLRVVIEGGFDFEYLGEVEEVLDKVTQAREEIVGLLRENKITRQEMIESLKSICGSVTIGRALKGLLAEKVIAKSVGMNNTHTYYLVEDTEGEQVGFMV